MKKNKRLMNISLICLSVLLLTLSFSVIFSRQVDKPFDDDNVQMNEYVISNSDIFNYEYVETSNITNNYGVRFARITGFNTSAFGSYIASSSYDRNNDYINLNFPSVVENGGNEYPVMEINIGVTASSGYYETQFSKDSVTLDSSLGFNILEKIQKIVVPKSVQYISHGAFNQFKALTDVELPFIGTQREKTGTVDDAFLAIFGSQKYKVGSTTANFDSMRVTSLGGSYIQTPSGENLTNISDYTNWYDYSIVVSDADPTNTNVSQHTHKMVYPQKLKNIVITDEYSIDNHAFFYVPYVESIAVQFSEDLRAVGTDILNAASVGLSSFANCYWLKTVALPANAASDSTNAISSLSEGVFRQCESLHTVTNYIDYAANSFTEYAEEDQKVVIPNTTPITPSAEKTAMIPRAFLYGCRSVKYVTLPTDVIRIDDHAFDNCDNLSILDFKNNSYNKEIGLCRIPDYIKTIGEYAFAGCSKFTTLIVPNEVTEIEEGAFTATNSLTSVTLPFIGKCAGSVGKEGLFGYIFGTNATNQSLSSYVKQNATGDPNDSDYALYAIPSSIINVTITNETYVNSGAFMNCYFIKSLQINDSTEDGVKSTMFIGSGALAGCYGLEKLSIPFVGPYDVTNYNLDYVNAGNVIPVNAYPENTEAADYRLGWIFGTYDYSLVGMVPTEQLSSKVFYISPKLEDVALTRQTLLLTDSFYGIKTLKTVAIDDYTKYSQKWIFGENNVLETISMPFVGATRGYKYWDWDHGHGHLHDNYSGFADTMAYYFRYNGTYNMPGKHESSVDCPFDQIYYYGGYWYDRFKASIPKTLANITITDETYFTGLSFRALDFVTNIRIEQSDSNKVRDMIFEADCFLYCTRLESLTIPFIGRNWNPNFKDHFNYTMGYMFGYGTGGYIAYQHNNKVSFPLSLKRIEVGSDIDYISSYAFNGMKSLESFKTDASISSMGAYCFANCTALETVEMENASYTRIPSYAFYNDILLHDINEFAPDTVKVIGAYSLSGTSIPGIDLSLYDSIETGALSNCLQIKEVDFSIADFNVNLTIGDYLFANCKNLSNVTLRNGYVTKYMFMNCTSLQGLVYDGIAEYIPEGLFYGCSALKSQYIDGSGTQQGLILTPESCGVKTIGKYAFYGCSSLVDFKLPNALEVIGECAFQNCKGLTSLTIPRYVESIPYGTYNGQDRYDWGAFYGCNDEFYFEVYYNESEWPLGWKTNWNCYFPVKTIGASTENMFTYAYSSVLKGYLISGLNVYDATNNPLGYKFVSDNTLVVKDTLVFPDTYQGVKVYGLTARCFETNDDLYYTTTIDGDLCHYLQNVDKFVLGKNYIYMGKNALVFDVSGSGSYFREVYVPNSSNFAKSCSCIDCGELIYETTEEKDIKSSYQSDVEADLAYDFEIEYIENAIVYYNEAWQYNGTNIVWKTTALQFELIADSFTYALGVAIKPEIIGVTPNQTYIKYAGGSMASFAANGNDRIINAFYPDGTNNPVNLSPIRITYTSNINVGTGKIAVSPVDSRFTGPTAVYFTISPYKIDVGYESTTDKAAFGVYSETDQTELSAMDHFASIIEFDTMQNYQYNKDHFKNLRTVSISDKVFDGKSYKISSWHNGRNIFLPSSSYTFTGVLATDGVDSGFYIFNNGTRNDPKINKLFNSVSPIVSEYKNRVLNSSGEHVNYSIGGFTWITTPRLFDANGNDVSRNFYFNVTLAVYIKPYQVTEESLTWPGGTYVLSGGQFGANYYEFQYTGNPVLPYPQVQDPVTFVNYNPDFKVSVNPEKPIYPIHTDPTGADLNSAVVTSYNSRNFRIPTEFLSIKFAIVNAELVIDLQIPEYLIGETEEQVVFNFDDIASFEQEYNLSYMNLHNHRISGQLISLNPSTNLNWTEGEYTYSDPTAPTDRSFTWDLTNIPSGYKIYNADGIDCTEYFNVTYNIKLKIIYNTFDYNLTVNSYDAFKQEYVTHPITGIDEKIGVLDYSETSNAINITFGADGYEHIIDAEVHNVEFLTTLIKVFNYNSTDLDNFKFTDLKEDGYVINFRLEKTRYYTLSKTITLKVIKSDYVLLDITKEYDREPVDVLDVDRPGLARLPIDFDPDKVSITYYKLSNKNLAIDAPSAIGEYIFKIVTEENHSSWFNDLLATNFTSSNSMEFDILQRSIFIDVVDDVAPFDSKLYDGEPWKLVVTDTTESKYNLLPGDSLTGYFVSRSAEIGVYDSSVAGTFRSFTPWSVINNSLIDSDQTSNYKIVYRGIYEIKPLPILYTSAGVTATYSSEDPQYYSIDLTVHEPKYGYTIYYSMVELPENDEKWEDTNKPYFISPGVYPVYFKIVAPHYQTVLGQETVTIEAATMDFGCNFTQRHNYDGFPHYLDVQLLNGVPSYATIYYAQVTEQQFGNLSSEDIKRLNYTTNIPSRTELGSSFFYVVVEARNFEPISGMFTLKIEDQGIGQGIDVLPFEDYYDTNSYGPIIDFGSSGINPNDVIVQYYVGDSINDANVVWHDIDLWKADYANSYNGKWLLPLMSEATEFPIKVSVRTLVRGYSVNEEVVTVHIKNLTLDLGIQNHNAVFDNKYHTVVLTAGSSCYDLVIEDKINDDGTINYIYYFSASLFVELKVRYHTVYNPMIGTAGFTSKPIREKNVCDKAVYLEVSADNCDTVFFNNGRITIKKNERPQDDTIYSPDMDIEYLARNIEYKDLMIETPHDAAPIITWTTLPSGLETSKTKELGSYHVKLVYPDTTNCATMTLDIDFDVVTRKVKLDYAKEVEYDGMIENYPDIGLVTVSPCDDEILLADLDNIIENYLVPYKVGTYSSDYKDVYSGYQLLVEIDPTIQEYELVDGTLTYDIIKRKLYITYDIEVEYTGDYWKMDLDHANLSTGDLINIPNGTINQLLYGHRVQLHFETANFRRGLYVTNGTLSTNLYGEYSKTAGTSIVKVSGKIVDNTTGDLLDLYDLVLDLKVMIKYKKLDVTVESKTIPFDNNYHSLDIVMNSLGVVSYNVVYWLEENPEFTFTSFSEKEVGIYNLCYRITPEDEDTYEPFEGKAVLEIEKSYLQIDILPLDKIYDGNNHTVEHEITNSGFKQFETPQCQTYYFSLKLMEEKRVTKDMLDKLFTNLEKYQTQGVPNTEKELYKLYQSALTTVVNAGDYYAYVYYENTHNYYASFGSEVVTLKRRPLYFINETPMDPLIAEKIYDGVPLYASLKGFIYDDTDGSENRTLPDAGLIMDGTSYIHDFADRKFNGYEFMTASANCKLDANGDEIPYTGCVFDASGNIIGYTDEPEFLFAPSTIIKKASSKENLYDNYYPVFKKGVYTDPVTGFTHENVSVRLKILRAELEIFDVTDLIGENAVEFNGKDVLPQVETPSDGKLIYFYQKVYFDEDGNKYYLGNDPTLVFENQKEISRWIETNPYCYYEVYVSIDRGTNYHAWKGESVSTPITKPAKYDGYYYKSAYVEVIPAKVEIDWGNLEAVYDGENNVLTPRFNDVATGNYRYLLYDVQDSNGEYITSREMIEAGSYSLTAKLASVAAATGFDSKNYEFLNPTVNFDVLCKHYTIKVSDDTDYLFTAWTKTFTEADFETYIIPDDPLESWLLGHTLTVTLKTNPEMAGRFNKPSNFLLDYAYYNADGDNVTDSLVFTIDADVLLRDGAIRYETNFVETPYDNQYHKPDVAVTSHLNGYTIKYFSFEMVQDAMGDWIVPNDFKVDEIPWGAATNDAPKFIDVGYYRVYFQISVNGKTEIGYTDVHIKQADSFILFGELGLDRVYSGGQIGDSALRTKIKGGYNGNSSHLVFTWYDPESADPNAPLATEPYKVGKYRVVVTSNGDNNDAIIQNYTELEEEYVFEITPATLTLVVKSDLVVTHPNDLSDSNVISGWNKTNIHRTEAAESDTESILYGLKGSDFIEYQLEFVGSAFEIKQYEYFDKTRMFASSTSEKVYSDLFQLYWVGKKTTLSGDEDISDNYKLYFDFKLKVHYPNAKTKVLNKAFDYDGVAKYFYDGTNGALDTTDNLMVIEYPNVASLIYGLHYSVYYKTSKTIDSDWILVNSADDVGFTVPGTYVIYYKVVFNQAEQQYYTDATGSVELKINFQQRECEISIDAASLVYNGDYRGKYYYDEDSLSILDYIDVNVILGDKPDKALWGIQFYNAIESSSGWIKTGLPMEKIIDSGNYMVEVTIPESALYAKTVLYVYLPYTRRAINIIPEVPGTSIKMVYNGSSWRYNLADDPENYFKVTNLVDGHILSAATMVCKATEVGIYNDVNSFSFETIKPGDYKIVDDAGKDVTHNYTYVIQGLTLEIVKAKVTIRITPNDTRYDFPGEDEYITPTAVLLNPVGYNHMLSYSIDGSNWQSSPFQFHDVGNYELWVKSSGIPNYEDKIEYYSFEITMKNNEIIILPMDKVYDAQESVYPTIRTKDGFFGLADPNRTIEGENIVLTWSYYDDAGIAHTLQDGERPVNVGKYNVRVRYPDTTNYYYTEDGIDFYITPLEIGVDIGNNKDLVYNTMNQSPAFDFYKKSDGYTISYLSLGVDYQILYFEKNDSNVYNNADGTTSKPKNVGSYVMRITIIGDTVDNVKFDVDTNVIETDIYFNIIPRDVKVEYAATVKGTTSVVVVQPTDLQLTNFPSTVTFESPVQTASNVSKTYYYQGIYEQSKWDSNGTLLWVSPYLGGPAIKFSDGTYDSLSNYNMYVDITIIISNGVVPFTVNAYNEVYDGLNHSFYFKIELNPSEYDWTVEYSLNKSDWTLTKPEYKDAMTAPVHVFVRVVVFVKGTSTPSEFTPHGAVILCENSSDPLYSEFEIMIKRADTEFTIPDDNLNRVYDATATENPVIKYNYFESDNRDSELQFSYYMKVVELNAAGDPVTNYQLIAREDVVNVGEYKLVITMIGSKNYKAAPAPVEIDFKIFKRNVYVKVEGDKTYDGVELGFPVNNTNLVVPTGVSDAGIISGHKLAGVVLTNSANYGEYTTHNHFKWHEEYTITNDFGISVKSNYNVIIYGFAKINKAVFDFEVVNGHGVYINDNTFYYIQINFLTTPMVSTNIMEDLLFYTDDPSKDLNNPASYDKLENIGVCKGTKTIYFMIQAENYTTVFGSGVVVVEPNNTEFTITSWPGLTNKLYYTGIPYDYNAITYTIVGGEDYSRVPTWKFYDENKVELPTGVIPTDEGKYFFKGFVEETYDNTYSPAESEYIPFTIHAKELTLSWDADVIEYDVYSNTIYYMYFTGSVVTPTPSALDVFGQPLQFTVSLTSGDGINVGPHACKAEITDPTIAHNYTLTFVGATDTVNYTIKGNGPIPNKPTGPDDPDFPPYLDDTIFTPGCDYILSKLVFLDPQGNPLDSYNPYVYGDEYVIEATGTYICVDCNAAAVNHKLIFQMDKATGEITTINGITVDPQAFKIWIDYDAPLKTYNDGTETYHYHEAIASLNDTTNQSWDISDPTNSKSAITVKVKVALDPIPETDIEVVFSFTDSETGVVTSPITDFKFKYTGNPITFDAEVQIVKKDEFGNEIERILLNPYQPPTSTGSSGTGDYVIYWYKNVDVTDNGASLCIESLPASGYSFTLGNPESGSPTDHYKQFSIYKEFPDYIQLADKTNTPHYLNIQKVVQNYDGAGVNEIIMTPITYDDRLLIVDPTENPSGIPANTKFILDGFYQGNTLDMILSVLNNPLDCVTIQFNNKVIFDGAISQTHTLDPDTGALSDPIESYMIKTGLEVCLFEDKDDRINCTDKIETVLYGDVDKDGYIAISDVTAIAEWLLPGSATKPKYNEANSIAGLVSYRKGETTTTTIGIADITGIAGFLEIGKISTDPVVQQQYDFNYQYKPVSSSS